MCNNIYGDRMKVNEIMSRNLITCDDDDSVLFVCNLMRKYDVGLVLVVNDEGLLGVITDRDIVCLLSNGLDKVLPYINTNVITVDEDEDVLKALEVMKDNKIKRLVVTHDDLVTGVISISDLFNTDISSEEILSALKVIYAIDRDSDYFEVDVHEFPL